MKKTLAFVLAAFVATAAFAGSGDSMQEISRSRSESTSLSKSMAQSSGVSSASSETVNGMAVAQSSEGLKESSNRRSSAEASRGSHPRKASHHSGATKTRCVTKKFGDVEEKVCQYTTISMEEADTYFAAERAQQR